MTSVWVATSMNIKLSDCMVHFFPLLFFNFKGWDLQILLDRFLRPGTLDFDSTVPSLSEDFKVDCALG